MQPSGSWECPAGGGGICCRRRPPCALSVRCWISLPPVPLALKAMAFEPEGKRARCRQLAPLPGAGIETHRSAPRRCASTNKHRSRPIVMVRETVCVSSVQPSGLAAEYGRKPGSGDLRGAGRDHSSNTLMLMCKKSSPATVDGPLEAIGSPAGGGDRGGQRPTPTSSHRRQRSIGCAGEIRRCRAAIHGWRRPGSMLQIWTGVRAYSTGEGLVLKSWV